MLGSSEGPGVVLNVSWIEGSSDFCSEGNKLGIEDNGTMLVGSEVGSNVGVVDSDSEGNTDGDILGFEMIGRIEGDVLDRSEG